MVNQYKENSVDCVAFSTEFSNRHSWKHHNSNRNAYKRIILIGVVIIILIIISIALTIFANMDILSSLRITFGSLYVLLLPGFILSYIFFPKTKEFDEKESHKGSIDWIERIALSFALSIAIVPLVVFYLNLIGIKINLLNSFLTILGIIVVSISILVYKYKQHKSFGYAILL